MNNLSDLKNLPIESQDQYLQNRDNRRNANIRDSAESRPRMVGRRTFALDTARSFKDQTSEQFISEPFDAIFVETATDDTTNIRIAYGSNEQHIVTNFQTLKIKDNPEFEFQVREAMVEWDAQPGKSITVLFFLGVKFRTGTQQQTITGGVTQSTGSSMTPQSKVTVNTTATLLFAASATRKVMTIQNQGANPIWISGTTAVTIDSGASPGIKLDPGDSFEWTNTGACYAIASPGSSEVSLNLEA